MIPIVWYGGHEKWDQDVVDVIAPSTCEPTGNGTVVVIPGAAYADSIDDINNWLNQWSWVIVIITSDEESLFPYYQLLHPNIRIWLQTPHPSHFSNRIRYLPLGCPLSLTEVWSTIPADRPQPLPWYFHGQVTHLRREECLGAMQRVVGGVGIPSPGFTQGIPRIDYLRTLTTAKIVPCPSGPACADTFRVWESLEAGAIPIVDEGPKPDAAGRAIAGYPSGFWRLLLGGEPPFPVVQEWSQVPEIAEELLADWPMSANRVFAWWQWKKREMRNRLLDDVGELGGNWAGPVGSNMTVLIPTSPTPNNPDSPHLDAVYSAVRTQLPDSEILLLIDGIRDEQLHYRDSYNEYIRRILWKCNHHWSNITPILFDRMEHQSGKVREALKHVRTDFILFNEHDAPLQGEIDWDLCIRELADDHLDLIRFYHEAAIHPEHEHLMLGNVHPNLVATEQWSGRPHLARTDYYRRIMDEHFSDASRTFIEWTMHSICQTEEWSRNRMVLYAPSEGSWVRSTHLDARGGDPTYEEVTIA